MIEAGESEAITRSLELAGEAGGDLTGAVYARLFARYPEMEAQFVRDTTGAVRGEMLAKVFEMVLDYTGAGGYAEFMVRNERVTHEGYDVPGEIFPAFFDTVVDTLRETLGPEWTPQMSAAWAAMLADFRVFAAGG